MIHEVQSKIDKAFFGEKKLLSFDTPQLPNNIVFFCRTKNVYFPFELAFDFSDCFLKKDFLIPC